MSAQQAMLQRKCGCGGSCEDCAEKKELQLSRHAGAPDLRQVPESVHDVLRSPGSPLNASLRTRMESRFGQDFSQVRLHDDGRAAASASEIGARAYTAGQHVVLGTAAGDERLLAHELAHTIQQRSMPSRGALTVGAKDDPMEAAADRAADAAVTGQGPIALADAPAAGVVQRDDGGAPNTEAPKAYAGTPLKDDALKAKMKKTADDIKVPNVGVIAVPTGARMVLHDTSADKARARLEEIGTKENRGPLGGGIAAYNPRTGTLVQGRENLFETYRPTATEFEKGLELFEEKDDRTELITVGKTKRRRYGEELNELWADRRDKKFRAVYALADPKKVDEIFVSTMSGQKLTTDTEIPKERLADPQQGKAPLQDQFTGATKKPSDKPPRIFTAAAFTIEAVCDKAKTKPEDVAAKGQAKALQTECAALTKYFALRNERVSQSANVEIVQKGVNTKLIEADEKRREAEAAKKKAAAEKAKADPKAKPAEEPKEDEAAAKERIAFEKRSQYKSPKNTCDLRNPYILPFATVPYSKSQYDNIRGLYFRAALGLGYYPKLTTHYETDGGQGHCDPRCFDLTRLYSDIADSLGHAAGSTYGITPKYAIGGGATVWWDDTFCHGKKPA